MDRNSECILLLLAVVFVICWLDIRYISSRRRIIITKTAPSQPTSGILASLTLYRTYQIPCQPTTTPTTISCEIWCSKPKIIPANKKCLTSLISPFTVNCWAEEPLRLRDVILLLSRLVTLVLRLIQTLQALAGQALAPGCFLLLGSRGRSSIRWRQRLYGSVWHLQIDGWKIRLMNTWRSQTLVLIDIPQYRQKPRGENEN